jgi:transposase
MDEQKPPFDIPPEDWAATPRSVRSVVRALLAVSATYQQQIAELLARVAELEARLNQHSQNSSKPPSSDPPSAPPRPPKTPRGRPRGAQPGHERAERPIPEPDTISEHRDHYPTTCPSCCHDLSATRNDVCLAQTQYVWELPIVTPIITAHHYHTVSCRSCGALVTAPRPPDVPPGAFGPRCAATLSLLHGCYRDSHRESKQLLSDLFGLPISLGSVANLQGDVSVALKPVFDEIQAVVQAAPTVNVDETGWKQAGKRRWLWTMVSAIATLFCITTSRSGKTLRWLVGEDYAGIVTSDRGSWYMWLDDQQHQLCWSHLIRNFRALAERHSGLGLWANDWLALGELVFRLWHAYRGGTIDREQLQAAMKPLEVTMQALVETGARRADAGTGLCVELLAHWEALWTFVRVDGVEPTNNRAERALRPAVLWRKGCFGAQSEGGNQFVERLLTVAATCRQQQRHLLAFLTEAVEASWQGRPPPRLLSTP